MAKNEIKTELSAEQAALAKAAQAADVGSGEAPPLPKQPQRSPKLEEPSKEEREEHFALEDELAQLEEEHHKLSLKAKVKELREKVRALKHGNRSDDTISQMDKREKLRRETRIEVDREGKKFAHYVVGAQKSYVHGVMLEQGNSVRVPYDELPSHTWKAVKAAKPKQDYEAAE